MTEIAHVAIVDDDPDIARSIERLVKTRPAAAGMTITTSLAYTAGEALEIIDQLPSRPPPRVLVISDFNLGGRCDGLQVLEEIQRDRPWAKLVLISGTPQQVLAERPEFELLWRFLPKPFSLADLRLLLDDFLAPQAAVR